MGPRARAGLRLALGLCLLIALVWHVDAGAILREFRALAPAWVAVAAACILAATVLGAANVYIFIARVATVGWWRFVRIYWIGWALGLVIPGQVGDIAGVAAMLRRHDVDWHSSLGAGLLDKAISLAVMSGLAVVAMALAGSHLATQIAAHTPPLTWVVPWFAAAALLLVVFQRRLMALWIRTRRTLWMTLMEMRRTLRERPDAVALNATLTIVKIGLIGTAYWAVFRSLGYPAALLPVVTLAAVSSLVAYVPISVNGVGTVEAVGIVLFASLGIPAVGVLAAYLVLRALVFTLAWGPAAVCLLHRTRGA